jgi:hypothetical protein
VEFIRHRSQQKYMARKPRIAMTLPVSTMKGSRVIAKMTRMESAAKIKLVNGIRQITMKSAGHGKVGKCGAVYFSETDVNKPTPSCAKYSSI